MCSLRRATLPAMQLSAVPCDGFKRSLCSAAQGWVPFQGRVTLRRVPLPRGRELREGVSCSPPVEHVLVPLTNTLQPGVPPRRPGSDESQLIPRIQGISSLPCGSRCGWTARLLAPHQRDAAQGVTPRLSLVRPVPAAPRSASRCCSSSGTFYPTLLQQASPCRRRGVRVGG